MSSYLNVFLRNPNNNTYMSLGYFGRNSTLYQTMSDYVPYEKIKRISRDTLETCLERLQDMRDESENYLKTLAERKTLIANSNNTIQDKLDFFVSIDESIADTKMEISNITEARNILTYWDRLIWDQENCYNESLIYAGIEASAPDGNPDND